MERAPAKKSFGQHFLCAPGVIHRIIDGLELSRGESVLEIGPGRGALTLPLHASGIDLNVVEADADMVAHLRTLNLDPPIGIVHADFLALDLARLLKQPIKVVSNLPYNVSVPITFKLMDWIEHIPLMVMMYQKEVARRIISKPNTKEYGTLSVSCQLVYDFDLSFNVAPGSFSPPPKVQSQVIRFRPKPIRPAKDVLTLVTKLVRTLFGKRRKQIGTIIRHLSPSSGMFDGACLLESLHDCAIDARKRPENLSPAQYLAWINRYKEHYGQS